MANPSEITFDAGAQLSPNPSLVLAPESALSLLPSRGLSSAPAVVVYPREQFWRNGGMKKQLILAALSDMPTNGHFAKSDSFQMESHLSPG